MPLFSTPNRQFHPQPGHPAELRLSLDDKAARKSMCNLRSLISTVSDDATPVSERQLNKPPSSFNLE
jgi:hypothetical protein